MSDFPRGNPDQRAEHEAIGTTEWTSAAEAIRLFEYETDNEGNVSPFLFGWQTDQEGHRRLLAYDDDAHIITFAGSRAGKGVSLILPNLLTYPGSVVVIDLKGENAAVTARHRAEVLGQQTIVLDPFRETDFPTASFNPLSALNPEDPGFIDDVTDFAEALIVRGDAKDSYWDDAARSVIKAILVYIVTEHAPEDCTLTWLRHYILNGVQPADPEEPPSFTHFLKILTFHEHPFVSGTAKRVLNAGGNERGSIISTVQRNTEFLDSRSVLDTLEKTDLDLTSLRDDRRASIYLVMPEMRLAGQSRWLRLLVTVFLRHLQIDKKQSKNDPPVLFVLDEFAALGYMQVIERATGYIAGFGVRIWSVLQDLSQLRGTYPERWETFIGNAGLLTAFGNVDLTTQKYLSERLGKCEAARVETNYSGGTSRSDNRVTLEEAMEDPTRAFEAGGSNSENEGWSRRPTTTLAPLLLPEEVGREFGKGRERLMCLLGQGQPVWAERIVYYDEEPFKSLAGESPFHKD